MSIQPEIKRRTSDQFIKLVSEKKTEAANAYLIKNSKRVREKGGGERPGVGEGGGTLTSSRKDWVEFYGCINRSQMTSHCNQSKISVLSLSERDREHETRALKLYFTRTVV